MAEKLPSHVLAQSKGGNSSRNGSIMIPIYRDPCHIRIFF